MVPAPSTDARAGVASRGTTGVGTPATSTLQLDSVSKTFETDRGNVTAITDVTLEVPSGQFAAIVGPSGCGKSTLLNLVAGLLAPSGGSIEIDGEPVGGIHDAIGYMRSSHALLPWRTLEKNVAFPLEIAGVPAAERLKVARQWLDDVGLSGFEKHYPHEVSHGMQQRVAVARTFTARPKILLLDEPFSALDFQTRVAVQDLFLEMWSEQGQTVVLITHDISEAVALADRVVVLSNRPGTVKSNYMIELPRPRQVEDLMFDEPSYQDYMKAIWQDLEG